MKNKYLLSLLNKEKIIIDSSLKKDVFFKMFSFVNNNNLIKVTDDFFELEALMQDDFYYVANESILYKGKKMVFNGELAIASKNNLLEFIKKSIENDDLRSLILSPLFENTPEYVLHIHDDVVFSKYIPGNPIPFTIQQMKKQ
jgi:hypothetical protein